MTDRKHSSAATIAALCIFNGLQLSPVHAPIAPYLRLLGSPVSPRFEQCRNYLSRFFNDGSVTDAFNPVEVFNGKMAAAPWIRGAVGMLQYTLLQEGVDVPDADAVDPAAWFENLVEFAGPFGDVEPLSIADVYKVFDAWAEKDTLPCYPESRGYFLSRLYGQARELQSQDEFLVTVSAITRARKIAEKS